MPVFTLVRKARLSLDAFYRSHWLEMNHPATAIVRVFGNMRRGFVRIHYVVLGMRPEYIYIYIYKKKSLACKP